MAISTQQVNQTPTSLEPIGTWGTKEIPVTVTTDWYKFFQSLSTLVGNIVGGVLGFTVDPAMPAAGGSQATATKLTTEWAVVTSGAGGVQIKDFGPGVPTTIINRSGGPVNVYTVTGGQIDALGANAPYALANNKDQTFRQTTETQWYSTQLG